MKIKTIFFAAMLLTLGVFVACSNDEDVYENNSLIALTKHAPANMDSQEDWREHIPEIEDECAFYALASAFKSKRGAGFYTSAPAIANGITATTDYNSIVNRARNVYGYDPEHGVGVDMNMFQNLSRDFGGEDSPLFGETRNMNSNTELQNYCSNQDSLNNIRGIVMEKDGVEHVAYVDYCYGNNIHYKGFNGTNYNGGNFNFNNFDNNNGYTIKSILKK